MGLQSRRSAVTVNFHMTIMSCRMQHCTVTTYYASPCDGNLLLGPTRGALTVSLHAVY